MITNLLLDVLKRSAPSRIVNVSSKLHSGTINFQDIEMKKSFSGQKAYAQSKLALILFTKFIAKKLSGTGVTANCVHPGFIATNLGRDANFIMRTAFKLLGKPPEKGAKTSIYVASSPDVEKITGEYFADKKVKQSSRESNDMKMAEKLWAVSEEYVEEFL